MPNDLLTGMIWSNTLPDWQREYYSMLLLETLRMKSILVPYCRVKTDYAAAQSGIVTYTEVYDTEPDTNALQETDIWLRGAHLDSRTVSIQLEIHGDILKFSDYNDIVQYVNAGDMNGLVREKIGQNLSDYLDLLARNAFAAYPHKMYGKDATSRATLQADDYLSLAQVAQMRARLEDTEVPGVTATDDSQVQTLVMTTTPRVIYEIRNNNQYWKEAQEYAGSARLFNGEAGTWGGVRFIRTNRLRLWNAGTPTAQTALNGGTNPGQGAARSVDSVYTVGQSNATPYVTVDSVASFAVGQYATIHSAPLGTSVLETDGTSETRRIVEIDVANNRLKFNKPLLKAHSDNDYVTTGLDVHMSILHGGPAVVYGVGEAPHVIIPPKYDDLMILNRYGWRGFLKFQLFRPEYIQVAESIAPAI